MHSYAYVIVGAGLAGANAVEGIREQDASGSILLLGAEPELPYERPPLSKQLWSGSQQLEAIYPHPRSFYDEQKVELKLGGEVVEINPGAHSLRDQAGTEYRYGKLLLATGGRPKRLPIPGGDLPGISYFRTVADYRALRAAAQPGATAVVIGGGFIGAEIAAALTGGQVKVTMVFPEAWLGARVFPEALGRALTSSYQSKGVRVLSQDLPTAIESAAHGFLVRTRAGQALAADMVVVGIGIAPSLELAQAAGLRTGDGVQVNRFLQTSDADIYAAGDLAFFPEEGLSERRIEHWDNAVTQGKHAGRNMAGAGLPFTDMPMFFSDLFEFGYEAVGEVDSRHEVVADWSEKFKTGVLYYLGGGRLRGAMMCNVWGKVDEARALIRKAQPVTAADLKGAIQA